MRRRKSPGDPPLGTCICRWNPRTKQRVQICYVGTSKKHRNGWKFTGRCGEPPVKDKETGP